MEGVIESVKRDITPRKSFCFVRKAQYRSLDDTGRIAIPDTVNGSECVKGIVVKCGVTSDFNLKEGDAVLYSWYDSYKTVTWDEEKLLCIPSRKILCVLFDDKVEGCSPLGSYVLAVWEEKKAEERGIILPEASRSAHYTAVVKAIGPDVKEVAVGDRIFFEQFGNIEKFVDGGVRFAIMQEKVIAAVIPAREE